MAFGRSAEANQMAALTACTVKSGWMFRRAGGRGPLRDPSYGCIGIANRVVASIQSSARCFAEIPMPVPHA